MGGVPLRWSQSLSRQAPSGTGAAFVFGKNAGVIPVGGNACTHLLLLFFYFFCCFFFFFSSSSSSSSSSSLLWWWWWWSPSPLSSTPFGSWVNLPGVTSLWTSNSAWRTWPTTTPRRCQRGRDHRGETEHVMVIQWWWVLSRSRQTTMFK